MGKERMEGIAQNEKERNRGESMEKEKEKGEAP